MRYCTRCITPSTRPNIAFDAYGVCNACTAAETRPAIDWTARERAFREVAEHAKRRDRGYDCLVPVSGGKDSTWQIVTCLEYGLKPLALTWRAPSRTEIGARNLANLVSLGVDHIDYQVSPAVEKRFLYRALDRLGSTAIPMHLAIFNMPTTIAVRFGIPLIVWGENSAFEYGGSEEERTGFRMDAAWLRKYGVTNGTTAADWISDELSEQDLTPYFGPTDAELEAAGVLGVFLGYYFRWDPEITLRVARQHGFQARPEGPKTGYYDYADIDDDFISIHHYLKWYKFGFTRLFDNLSIEIRNGRLSRAEAIDVVSRTGEQKPVEDIARFCRFVGIGESHFYDLIEKFRNRDIWTRSAGTWVIQDFLVPDWRWT